MTERDPAQFATTNISQVVSAWLRREFQSSSAGHNSVLDQLDELRAGIHQPINTFNMKFSGHASRMDDWFTEMHDTENSSREAFAARITFGGLMFISGMYRNQRFIDSKDQEDYYDRKWFNKSVEDPIGVSIPNVIGRYIKHHTYTDGPTLKLHNPSLDSLDAHAKGVLATTALWTSEIIESVRSISFNESNPHAQRRTKGLQAQWLAFTAHSILQSAAERNDDLRQAPVLEAKSITLNPALIRPFGLADANNNALLVPELLLK